MTCSAGTPRSGGHVAATLAALALLALMAEPARAWKIVEVGTAFSHKLSGDSVQLPAGWTHNNVRFSNVATLADEPTGLAGRTAFRLQFEYRLPVQRGAIRYRAPALHYIDRDAAVFNETLKTFTIAQVAARR